jgi:hypothetical protein
VGTSFVTIVSIIITKSVYVKYVIYDSTIDFLDKIPTRKINPIILNIRRIVTITVAG